MRDGVPCQETGAEKRLSACRSRLPAGEFQSQQSASFFSPRSLMLQATPRRSVWLAELS